MGLGGTGLSYLLHGLATRFCSFRKGVRERYRRKTYFFTKVLVENVPLNSTKIIFATAKRNGKLFLNVLCAKYDTEPCC